MEALAFAAGGKPGTLPAIDLKLGAFGCLQLVPFILWVWNEFGELWHCWLASDAFSLAGHARGRLAGLGSQGSLSII